MYWKCEISINLIINIMVLWYFWTRDGGFHGRHSTSIDLFRSTANWTDVWTKDATKRKARESRVRLHATSFFCRSCRHLKSSYDLLCFTSRGVHEPHHPVDTANCHDVTFLDPPLTNVSYACVRACVRACVSRCFKPDSRRERAKKFLLKRENDWVRLIEVYLRHNYLNYTESEIILQNLESRRW